ncbi:arylesterase [Telmatospirillum sp.]|uniref:arylesterase n=1 Tax=Telmatospirillum sp. TaxID=2079197 RepID=UPI00284A58F7|nr:arylesterase [Telmatospirillum sp.]MDR3440455.1 arylesterase [Telmatospirillum sp.]
MKRVSIRWVTAGRALWRRAWWGYGLLALFVNVTAAAAMDTTPIHILAFGDSLTAGYNLPAANAFPVRLEAALKLKGYQVRITNAGVSGDTTAGGRARLDWALADRPDFAIVELGANDALRGLAPNLAYENLDAILDTLASRHVKVLLAGMLAPRNMGASYSNDFDAIYPRLAAKWKVPLYPFFLDGVTLHPELTLPDGMHPNPQGVDRIVAGILPAVEALLGPTPKAAP